MRFLTTWHSKLIQATQLFTYIKEFSFIKKRNVVPTSVKLTIDFVFKTGMPITHIIELRLIEKVMPDIYDEYLAGKNVSRNKAIVSRTILTFDLLPVSKQLGWQFWQTNLQHKEITLNKSLDDYLTERTILLRSPSNGNHFRVSNTIFMLAMRLTKPFSEYFDTSDLTTLLKHKTDISLSYADDFSYDDLPIEDEAYVVLYALPVEDDADLEQLVINPTVAVKFNKLDYWITLLTTGGTVNSENVDTADVIPVVYLGVNDAIFLEFIMLARYIHKILNSNIEEEA